MPAFRAPSRTWRAVRFCLDRTQNAIASTNGRSSTDGPRNHPAIAHLKLGPLGNASRSGVIATKTLLFATVGDQINVGTPPGFGGNQFSAFDKRTGELLWTTDLEAGATGAPMTYMHRGKQYAGVCHWRSTARSGVRRHPDFVRVGSVVPAE